MWLECGIHKIEIWCGNIYDKDRVFRVSLWICMAEEKWRTRSIEERKSKPESTG